LLVEAVEGPLEYAEQWGWGKNLVMGQPRLGESADAQLECLNRAVHNLTFGLDDAVEKP
jgi:hypothetical protein